MFNKLSMRMSTKISVDMFYTNVSESFKQLVSENVSNHVSWEPMFSSQRSYR